MIGRNDISGEKLAFGRDGDRENSRVPSLNEECQPSSLLSRLAVVASSLAWPRLGTHTHDLLNAKGSDKNRQASHATLSRSQLVLIDCNSSSTSPSLVISPFG